MRTDNALIIGAKTPTDANGTVNRVCPGGYVDVIREGECRGDKIFISGRNSRLLRRKKRKGNSLRRGRFVRFRRSGSARTSFARNVPS